MKQCVVLIIMAVVGSVCSADDGIESLIKGTIFESITVTPTNLTVKFHGGGGGWMVRYTDDPPIGPARRTVDFAEKDEALIVTLDKRVGVFAYHGQFAFIPVAFKNQHKGFKILQISYHGAKITNAVVYVALSDRPVRVGEEDVLGEIPLPPPQPKSKPEPPPEPELKRRLRASLAEAEAIALANPGLAESKGIVVPPERGQFSRQDRAVTPPSREDNEKERLGETPSPYRLWLYILIPLCLFPILYFIRRKLKAKT